MTTRGLRGDHAIAGAVMPASAAGRKLRSTDALLPLRCTTVTIIVNQRGFLDRQMRDHSPARSANSCVHCCSCAAESHVFSFLFRRGARCQCHDIREWLRCPIAQSAGSSRFTARYMPGSCAADLRNAPPASCIRHGAAQGSRQQGLRSGSSIPGSRPVPVPDPLMGHR